MTKCIVFSKGRQVGIKEGRVGALIMFQRYILKLKKNRFSGPFKSPDIEIRVIPARTPSPLPGRDIRDLFVPPNRSQTVP
jgi:hypothetical protein